MKNKRYACPFCQEAIEYLDYEILERNCGTSELLGNGIEPAQNGDHNWLDTKWSEDAHYSCPKCKKELKPEKMTPLQTIEKEKKRIKRILNDCHEINCTFCQNTMGYISSIFSYAGVDIVCYNCQQGYKQQNI